MTESKKKQLQIAACKVRMGIIEGTNGAKAGHPGGSLSAADMFTYLYFKEMNVDPKNPKWEDRDRFVLIPGMTVICPADDVEARAAVKAAYEHQGPVYLRFGRLAIPVFHEEGFDFQIGKGEILRDGTDVRQR